jgi:hypothetical protein
MKSYKGQLNLWGSGLAARVSEQVDCGKASLNLPVVAANIIGAPSPFEEYGNVRARRIRNRRAVDKENARKPSQASRRIRQTLTNNVGLSAIWGCGRNPFSDYIGSAK